MKSAAFIVCCVALSACSDNSVGTDGGAAGSESPPRLVLPEAQDAEVTYLDWDTPDVEADAEPPPPPPTCLGQPIECCQTQYWYCPESFQGESLYRMETIVNICDENGVPCTPTGLIGDEDEGGCEWQIVTQSECEEAFQCNPMGDMDLGSLPCEIEVEGEVLNGFQQVVCNKGHVQYGPCDPCTEEVCDGVDNDCDGTTDEGEYQCQTECGNGLGICVGGEIVLCDAPVSTPEVCDGMDNDCDDETDEELVRGCESACEAGVEWCIEGEWSSCTAAQPMEEECDGLDNNCNGLVDEGLQCACPPEMVGALMPCMEDPLVCGQGFKTCECADDECSATQMTQCLALCNWLPPNPNQECDPHLGIIMPEICNNFDDDCDVEIDENLVTECYTGDGGTEGVGICHAGEMVCEAGAWGGVNPQGVFVPELCIDEQTPLEEDLCSGKDDNCDGVIEKVMEPTDILFIVDTSGSMSGTINAVQQAMTMFSNSYSDQEVIQWGLIVGPVDQNDQETLHMATNLVPFQQFLPVLAQTDDDNTSKEMLYDALFLAIRNLVNPVAMPPFPIFWDDDDVASSPTLNNFTVNWREDAKHVVIVFSDEKGQSYLSPETTQEVINQYAAAADDLHIYTFSDDGDQNGPQGWGPVVHNGEWNMLTSNALQMFDRLMQIIDETACGGGGENPAEVEQEAAFTPMGPLYFPYDAGRQNEGLKYILTGHYESYLYRWDEMVCLPPE